MTGGFPWGASKGMVEYRGSTVTCVFDRCTVAELYCCTVVCVFPLCKLPIYIAVQAAVYLVVSLLNYIAVQLPVYFRCASY